MPALTSWTWDELENLIEDGRAELLRRARALLRTASASATLSDTWTFSARAAAPGRARGAWVATPRLDAPGG
jgi:hypothetical protein